jgi:hypothetical protein
MLWAESSRRVLAIVMAGLGCGLVGPAILRGQEGTGFVIDRLGLYDAPHMRNDGFNDSSIKYTTTTGFVAGYTKRWNGDSYAGTSAWIYDSRTGVSTKIGLEDPEGLGRWSAAPMLLNSKGQVGGVSLWTSSSEISRWSWFYDSTLKTQKQIGFYDEQHTNSYDGGQTSVVQALTESGHAFGDSMRYNGSEYVGRSVWVYDSSHDQTTRIGLFGAEYTRPDNGEQLSDFAKANTQGYATGHSWYYTDTGSHIAAWSYNPDTAAVRRIGLNDPNGSNFWGEYSGNDGVIAVLENRRVIGHNIFDTEHDAVWVHDDATNTTVRTGLIDREHTSPGLKRQYSEVVAWNSTGQLIGKSERYPVNEFRKGWSGWTYDPDTQKTTRLGFTDAEHTTSSTQYKNSWVTAINESGMVIGGSQRLGGADGQEKGATAWLYDPAAGSTTKLGNLSAIPGTVDYVYNLAELINNRGQVVGWSQQTAGHAGMAMWMYDSSSQTTRQIGLRDILHTHPTENYQTGSLAILTDDGLVAGHSRRLGIAPYSSDSGQTAWLYDYDTDTTTSLIFSQDAAGHADSVVRQITDTGLVFGLYRLYEGDLDEITMRTFVGNLDVGFYDLNSLVTDGLAPAGWDRLADEIHYLGSVSPDEAGLFDTSGGSSLLDWNRFAGMGYRLDGNYGPYALRPVPEPSSLALVSLGIVTLIGWRWRRSRTAA